MFNLKLFDRKKVQKAEEEVAPAQPPLSQRFLTLPPNLGNGLPRQGAKVLIGRFSYAGLDKRLGEDVWQSALEVEEPAWRSALFGFVWLDDLATHGGEVAAKKARELVISWLDRLDQDKNSIKASTDVWRADIVAARMSRLLRRATFLFSFAPPAELRGRLLSYLSWEASNLLKDRGANLNPIRRVRAQIGGVLASMCLDGHEDQLPSILKELEDGMDKVLLADGMIASRSARDQVGILFDLVGLQLAFAHANRNNPNFISVAVKRMIPALRMLRHGDGGLALFHGSREGRKDVIDAAIMRAGVMEKAPTTLPYGGYTKMQVKHLLAIMDIGKVPRRDLCASFHASPLAIEVSNDADRIITNCGEIRLNDPAWQKAAKSTAAHSNLNLADMDAINLEHPSAEFNLEYERSESDGAIWLTAWHNGYENSLGAIVTRKLYMSATGRELLGEERISETKAPVPFCLRFHIHPDVQVTLVGKGKVPLLRTKGGASWWLRSQGGDFNLANSVYLGGEAHVVPTKQLVLEGMTGDSVTIINWVLESADAI